MHWFCCFLHQKQKKQQEQQQENGETKCNLLYYRFTVNRIIRFLGEMQRNAFRLMLSSLVCVCVCVGVCVCECVCEYVCVCVWKYFTHHYLGRLLLIRTLNVSIRKHYVGNITTNWNDFFCILFTASTR